MKDQSTFAVPNPKKNGGVSAITTSLMMAGVRTGIDEDDPLAAADDGAEIELTGDDAKLLPNLCYAVVSGDASANQS